MNKSSIYTLYVLAWTVVVGFLVLLAAQMVVTIPKDNVGPVNQLFGALATGFGVVLSFFFGSSKSSQDKTAIIAALPALPEAVKEEPALEAKP